MALYKETTEKFCLEHNLSLDFFKWPLYKEAAFFFYIFHLAKTKPKARIFKTVI